MGHRLLNKKNSISHSPDIFPSDTVEVKIFQNKTNHQFNLPVLKRNTSPRIIQDILGNKDIVGLKFKITDVILRNAMEKDVILRNNKKLLKGELANPMHLSLNLVKPDAINNYSNNLLKGGRTQWIKHKQKH